MSQREANRGGPPAFAYVQQLVRSTSKAAQSQVQRDQARSQTHWQPIPAMDHLACFAPGLLALGDMELGHPRVSARTVRPLVHELMRTCVATALRTTSGIAPEISRFDALNTKVGGLVDDAKVSFTCKLFLFLVFLF